MQIESQAELEEAFWLAYDRIMAKPEPMIVRHQIISNYPYFRPRHENEFPKLEIVA